MFKTPSKSNVESTIRAGVDVKNFLNNMKYAFTSSSTYLGELMQNSRRAGATKVEFKYDSVTKTLTVDDDGTGILDFEALVVNSRSGWDEAVQDSDSPFGMGFYSVFFACEEVVVESLGGRLTATKDQIVNCEDLHVMSAETADRGTRITMRGLHGGPEYEISRLAMGFPIPVFLNNFECPRTLAQEALKMEQTEIGLIHIPGIHDDRPLMPNLHVQPRLFLQGLPIKQTWTGSAVVHLNSKEFKARMPDRNTLFDEAIAVSRVSALLQGVVRQFLIQERARLTPEAFVERYWDNCREYGVLHLLDDIQCVPKESILKVFRIDYDGSVWPADNFNDVVPSDAKVVSRDQLIALGRPIVLDPPLDIHEESGAAQLLSAMKLTDMYAFNAHRHVSSNHWIHSLGIPADDLCVTHEPIEPTPPEDAQRLWVCDIRVEIHLARMLGIKVTRHSNGDVICSDDTLVGFFIEEVHGEEDSFHRVWIASMEHFSMLVTAFTDFRDENETYVEAWEDSSAREWQAAVNTLRRQPLDEIVRSAINHDVTVIVREDMVGQSCLVAPTPDAQRLSVVNLSQGEFWAALASKLAGQDLSAQALQDAFQGVLNQQLTSSDAASAT